MRHQPLSVLQRLLRATQRIEFLPTFLRSWARTPVAVREGVRVALADCEAIFRAQEDHALHSRARTDNSHHRAQHSRSG
jgi:hypothetical protein